MNKGKQQKNDGNKHGIGKIQNESNEPEWRIIGGVKRLFKKCSIPTCDNITYYTNKTAFHDATVNLSTCLNCRMVKKIYHGHEKWKRDCPNSEDNPNCEKTIYYDCKWNLTKATKNNSKCKSCSVFGKNNPQFGKIGELSGTFNRKHTDDEKAKMGQQSIGNTYKLNYITSSKTKLKMRLSAIKRIERNIGKISPNYNPKTIPIWNEINETLGWKLQHAEDGGEFHVIELGYWIDAYDKERNIAIEFDEYKHFRNGILIDKDVIKQKEITEFLGCKFYRIKYNQTWQEVLSEYITNE